MVQVTLRLDDALAHDMKRVARDRGESVNAFAARILSAAVDPQFAGTEADRLRERLAAAGLGAVPTGRRTARPDPELLAQAQRAAAGSRKLFSDYVSEDRGE